MVMRSPSFWTITSCSSLIINGLHSPISQKTELCMSIIQFLNLNVNTSLNFQQTQYDEESKRGSHVLTPHKKTVNDIWKGNTSILETCVSNPKRVFNYQETTAVSWNRLQPLSPCCIPAYRAKKQLICRVPSSEMTSCALVESLPSFLRNVSIPSSRSKINKHSCLLIAFCLLGLILDSEEWGSTENC
jgi:hypothetical protein